ncbi:MAG: response regulator [Alphaproteobacteria bacterium]|nr:response regulator [Alphaproteobacteria bacterium]MBF0251234.1 response regulator [Alphaproteobacteria bacterium]
MIVEDNVHFLTLLRSILQALGFTRLIEAHDGIEGVEILGEQSVDLVIVDWKMQGMDGVECVRQIRGLNCANRFVPIIMVTGYTEESLRNRARDAGVNGFLGKPVSPQSLLNRMQAVLNAQRQFIDTGDYFGPDRRTSPDPYTKADRRKSQAKIIFPDDCED